MNTLDSNIPQGLVIGAALEVQPAREGAKTATKVAARAPRTFQLNRELLITALEWCCYGSLVAGAVFVIGRALGWFAL